MREWMIGRCRRLVTAGRLAVATLLVFAATPAALPPAMSLPAHQLVASDPSLVGQWGPLMNWPLDAVHASLLPTGSVLLWDAWELGGTPSAQLWNPATGTFTPVPNQTSQIFCSAHVHLADGRLFVVGGHNGVDTGINDVNLFDPGTAGWSLLPAMSYARWYPSVAKLADGRVVAISGNIDDLTIATTPEVYNPTTNGWAQLTSVNTQINYDSYPEDYLLPDGRVFVLDSEGGELRLLDVKAGTWTAGPTSPQLFGSSTMYRPGKILASGGGANYGSTFRSFTSAETIDMTAASPGWTQIAPMTYPRYQHNLVTLPDGNVLAVGGSVTVDVNERRGSLVAEMWNPQTSQWSTMAAQQNPRMYHSTAVLLPDGRVLSAGGGRAGFANDYLTAEIFSPPYLFKGARPSITGAPTAAGYAGPMSVQSPDAASIASVALVSLASNTHTMNFGQAYVPLSFSVSGSTLTAQAPASPNVAPPGYYMLFLVNSSGVPSVARMVRLAQVVDTQPPVVSVTAPTAGATVSGGVVLAASATDNVGVAGVQFQVDGSPVGSPVTSPPYSLTWDSSTVPNGAHAISAKASDAAGNSAVSSTVGVTVANTSPLVINNVAVSGVTAATATVSWTTNLSATSQVEYGTTSAYSSSTALDHSLVTAHSQTLSGLQPSTTYHFRVASTDSSGNVARSPDGTFTTAGAPITFRSSSTVIAGTTVSAPAGMTAGDVLIANLQVDADPVTVAGPAGWVLALDTRAADGFGGFFHAQTWYKVATATEPTSYSWSVSGSPWVDIGLLDYTNVQAASPIDVIAGRDAGTTSTPVTSSITTTGANEMVVAVFINFAGGTWTAGSGMTTRFNFDGNTAQDALQATTGATGTKTATTSASGGIAAILLALRPRT